MKHTTDHSQQGPGHKAHGLEGLYDALRRTGIARASNGRWFAGVAAGLARRLGVDPLVVRAGFILLGLLFGIGVPLYLVFWLLMPDEQGTISLEQALKYGEGRSIFLLIVTALAVIGGGPWFGNDRGGSLRFFVFLALAAGTWWFLTRTDSGREVVRSVRASMNQQPSTPTRPQDPSAEASGPVAAGSPTQGMSTGNAAANAGAAWPPPSGAPLMRATTPVTLAVPKPPRQRTRGIGFAAGLLVLGAAILAAVGASRAAETAAWSGSHVGTGIAAGLGVLGLAIVVAGIAGRRSGWLAPFALAGMATSLVLSVSPAGLTQPWSVGEHTYSPASLSGSDSYQLGVGSLRLDLSGADHTKTPGVDRVTASVGMGDMVLTVPEGVRVTVNTRAGLGQVVAFDSTQGQHVTRDGGAVAETFTFGSADATEEVVVDASVGVGEITVRTGAAR